MEVTNENFEAIYPEMVKKIEECTFCSIDCELSGVTQYKDLNSFDTPKNRYDKLKKKEHSYLIIQFGLCVFKYKPEEKSYDTTAYNCFLFPRTRNCRYSRDYDFTSLNSSIEFLCEQKFDFNKVFRQGISFISKDVEETTRQRVKQSMENRDKPKSTIYPNNTNKDMKEQLDTILKDIDEFAENLDQSKKEIKFSDFLLRVYTEKNIKQKYFNRLRYENKPLENKERMLIITKVDPKNAVNELETLEKELGFSKIIWLLSKSQKLIVGHNMLTDVMQMIRQFFCSQLPDNFEDFKSMTRSIFPNLLDTKYMANVPPLKEIITATALGDMEKIVSKDPFPEIVLENCEYSTKDEKLHEAGYDAYLTGHCYARMMHYLETFNSSRKALEDFYSNKLYLMKSYDLSFIDLNAPQEEPKRDNVFYLEFPSTWENQDLFDLFSPYGSVHIGWINDTSAFVAIQNQDNVKKAAAQMVGVTGREFKCYFYSTYVKQLSKPKPIPPPASPVVGNTASEKPQKNGGGISLPTTPVVDKRKRGSDEDGLKDESDSQKKVKKMTQENSSEAASVPNNETKPFQNCADW